MGYYRCKMGKIYVQLFSREEHIQKISLFTLNQLKTVFSIDIFKNEETKLDKQKLLVLLDDSRGQKKKKCGWNRRNMCPHHSGYSSGGFSLGSSPCLKMLTPTAYEVSLTGSLHTSGPFSSSFTMPFPFPLAAGRSGEKVEFHHVNINTRMSIEIGSGLTANKPPLLC